jgi:kynureninase
VSQTQGQTRDELLEWREEFPTVEATLHFISHSLGAMPRAAEESLRRYTQVWKSRGIRAWEEQWMELPTKLGDVVGGIIGAEPGSVSMHENVTTAQAIALSAIPFEAPRNVLVCTEEDFPSLLYLYEGLAARRPVEIRRVASRGEHRVAEEDVISAIDERTALVAISHVLFRTSQVLDLEPIVSQAHRMGALVMVDAYQAVGAVPLDVHGLEVDLLTGGSVKWLCGGPGAAYLYVRPQVARTLEPAFTGWFGHENPFEFDTGPMRHDHGARRFWTGTPGIPSFAAARPGFEIVARIGVGRIRAKSLHQTERMIRWAGEFGFRVVSPRDSGRGGTVVLDVPAAERVCRALLASDVLLDHGPGVGLRLAPHFYTRDDEVDLVMKRVREEVYQATG